MYTTEFLKIHIYSVFICTWVYMCHTMQVKVRRNLLCVFVNTCAHICYTMLVQVRGNLQESPSFLTMYVLGIFTRQAIGHHSHLYNLLGEPQPGAWWMSSYSASWSRSWWHLERCRHHQGSHTVERQSKVVMAQRKVPSPGLHTLVLWPLIRQRTWTVEKNRPSVWFSKNPK